MAVNKRRIDGAIGFSYYAQYMNAAYRVEGWSNKADDCVDAS